MNHNFKTGDLALAIHCGNANNFKTVELIECIGQPEVVDVPGQDFQVLNTKGEVIWLVRSLGEPFVVHRKIREMQGVVSLSEFPLAERRLMPLRGDFTPEQQKAKEAEPCA